MSDILVKLTSYTIDDLLAVKTVLQGFLDNKLALDLVSLLSSEIEERKQKSKST